MIINTDFIDLFFRFILKIIQNINYKTYFHTCLLLISVNFSVSAQQLSKVVDTQIGSEGNGLTENLSKFTPDPFTNLVF